MLRTRTILCVSVLALLTAITLTFQLVTDGSLPSSTIAIELQDDVKAWANSSGSSTEQTAWPDTVKRLRPLSVEKVDGGVLIIFQRRFVEIRGYYFAHSSSGPPEELKAFCRSIGNNVYSYYDPG